MSSASDRRQRRRENIRKLLWNEVVGLYAQWQTYLTLFAGDKDSFELLNEAAPAFFATVQRTLIREIIMGVARLTDPVHVSGRHNLTLERLADHPSAAGDDQLRDELGVLVRAARAAAEPFREHRNRLLAHLDWSTHIKKGAVPLPQIRRADVDTVLASFAAVLNLFDQRVSGGTTFFNDVISHGGADSIVARLRDGRRWRAYRRHEMNRLAEEGGPNAVQEFRDRERELGTGPSTRGE